MEWRKNECMRSSLAIWKKVVRHSFWVRYSRSCRNPPTTTLFAEAVSDTNYNWNSIVRHYITLASFWRNIYERYNAYYFCILLTRNVTQVRTSDEPFKPITLCCLPWRTLTNWLPKCSPIFTRHKTSGRPSSEGNNLLIWSVTDLRTYRNVTIRSLYAFRTIDYLHLAQPRLHKSCNIIYSLLQIT